MKRRPLLLVIAVAALALLAMGAFAHADGPGGSTEHHQDCTNNTTGVTTHDVQGSCPAGSTASTHYTNDLECGSNNDVGGFDVFIGPSGLEICSDDDSPAPVQGRVMASGDPASQSGFVGADGDVSNSPAQAGGWIGVSSEAGTPVACGDDAGNHDLSHADGDDDIQDCMP
jgi:hypothetical protein